VIQGGNLDCDFQIQVPSPPPGIDLQIRGNKGVMSIYSEIKDLGIFDF
jgi:hypothetical protein